MLCFINKEGKIFEGESHDRIPGGLVMERDFFKLSLVKCTKCFSGLIWVGLDRVTPKQEKAVVDFCLKYGYKLPFKFDK